MHEPGEAGVEELLGELLALLDGGGLHDVLLVLLGERPLVRAPVLRGEPRRLARLRLQLRQPRRQSHGSTPAWDAGPAAGYKRVRYSVVRSREAEKNPALIRSAGDGVHLLLLGADRRGRGDRGGRRRGLVSGFAPGLRFALCPLVKGIQGTSLRSS